MCFPHDFRNHISPQCAKTNTKNWWPHSLASAIPHPLHVPGPHQPHRAASLLPSICIHTPARGKTIWLSWSPTRPMVNMKAAVSFIQEKANKAHSLVLAVSYSLRYDKHHSNPTICSSPVELLNLWKSCVLPHFLLYLCYISDETQVKTLQASLNKSLSTTMHVYGHPTALLSDTGNPPLYITQNLHLAQLRFRLYSSPPSTTQQCLWIRLKTACRIL